jgi:hypothetical protein
VKHGCGQASACGFLPGRFRSDPPYPDATHDSGRRNVFAGRRVK